MIVYKVTNLVNGKIYIGITRHTLNRRIVQHRYCAKSDSGYYFHRAIRKYSEDNFKYEICLYCEEKDAGYYERCLIELYKSSNQRFGYNLTNGGEFGYSLTTEKRGSQRYKGCFGEDHPVYGTRKTKKQRDALSELYTGAGNPMYGRQLSNSHKNKIRKAITGIKRSDDFRKKCRENNLGKNNHSYRHDIISDELVKLRNDGLTYQQIADIVNASPSGVRKRIVGYTNSR